MNVQTITIPAHKKSVVDAKIKKLAKKAAKYGNPEITVSYSEEYIAVVRDSNGEKQKISVIDATVTGDSPLYEGGWELIARVELFGENNLIHEVPTTGKKVDPRFRTHYNECEHCKTSRRRNDLFVFEGVNGDQMAVGRTCLRDFMGIDNPQAIVLRTSFFENMKNIEEEETVSYFNTSYSLKTVLAYAAAVIREEGFKSKAICKEEGLGAVSTADRVQMAMSNVVPLAFEVTDDDKITATKTIEYFCEMEMTGNNYIDNLIVIMKETVFNKKLIGIVVSAVAAYHRSVKEQDDKESKPNAFVGNIGERLRGLELTMAKEIFIGHTQYGEKFLYTFETVDGNVLVWFTSKQNFEIGNQYNIDATVKEHKVYGDANQTIITRAKIK